MHILKTASVMLGVTKADVPPPTLDADIGAWGNAQVVHAIGTGDASSLLTGLDVLVDALRSDPSCLCCSHKSASLVGSGAFNLLAALLTLHSGVRRTAEVALSVLCAALAGISPEQCALLLPAAIASLHAHCEGGGPPPAVLAPACAIAIKAATCTPLPIESSKFLMGCVTKLSTAISNAEALPKGTLWDPLRTLSQLLYTKKPEEPPPVISSAVALAFAADFWSHLSCSLPALCNSIMAPLRACQGTSGHTSVDADRAQQELFLGVLCSMSTLLPQHIEVVLRTIFAVFCDSETPDTSESATGAHSALAAGPPAVHVQSHRQGTRCDAVELRLPATLDSAAAVAS